MAKMATPAAYRSHSFEEHWNSAPPAHSISQERVERYDPLNGLFHAPTEYRYHPLGPFVVLSSEDEQNASSLLELVKGEFGSKSSRGHCPDLFRFETTEL